MFSDPATAQETGAATNWAQVQTWIETDGSLGLGDAGSVPHMGSVYEIGETQGARRGENLFHSFLHFDLREGDTARFSARDSRNGLLRAYLSE